MVGGVRLAGDDKHLADADALHLRRPNHGAGDDRAHFEPMPTPGRRSEGAAETIPFPCEPLPGSVLGQGNAGLHVPRLRDVGLHFDRNHPPLPVLPLHHRPLDWLDDPRGRAERRTGGGAEDQSRGEHEKRPPTSPADRWSMRRFQSPLGPVAHPLHKNLHAPFRLDRSRGIPRQSNDVGNGSRPVYPVYPLLPVPHGPARVASFPCGPVVGRQA